MSCVPDEMLVKYGTPNMFYYLKMYYDLKWSVFAINGSYVCLYTSNVCTR